MMFVAPMIVFIIGGLMGGLLLYGADCLISRKERAKDPARNDRIFFAKQPTTQESNSKTTSSSFYSTIQNISSSLKNSTAQTVSMMLINGAGWLCAVMIVGFNIQAVQVMVVISVALMISLIDIKARIIPNELVLMLFLSSLAFFFAGAMNHSILLHLLGLAIGLVLFSVPLLFESNVGGGDIKYIAAMGFCLGYPDIFRAVIILSGILLIWLIFITITKRGGLKMKFALGPFISIGFVTAMLSQRWR